MMQAGMSEEFNQRVRDQADQERRLSAELTSIRSEAALAGSELQEMMARAVRL